MEPSIKSTHAFEINKLKTSFKNITHTIDEINKIKLHSHKKLNCLRDAYFKLIENNSKKVFLFCLDSFYFQYKSFQLEYDNLEKTLSFINNRMYCDYYKLYNMMIENCKKHNFDDSDNYELRQYIQYKDLEPFLEYRIEDIKDIHGNILHIISILYEHYSTRHNSMTHYNETHKIGFSISNFINTLQYENSILMEQTVLYTNYIAFFHISQGKYLKRMYSKIENFYNEVESNIKSNVNFSINDINENPILNSESITESDSDSDPISDTTSQSSVNTINSNPSNNKNNILEKPLKVDINGDSGLQSSIPSTPSSISMETAETNTTHTTNHPPKKSAQTKMFSMNPSK
tara:strand:+ start:3349 stop:4386 length:1038 start_codon:yes stop_codon:yes gene_type:complete